VSKLFFYIAEDSEIVNENNVSLYRCAGYVVEFALIDCTSNGKCNHLCRNTIHRRRDFQPDSVNLQFRIK